MTMFIIYEGSEITYVDLFTQNEYALSIRDALLYMNFVVNNPTISNESIVKIQKHKCNTLYKKLSKRSFKTNYSPGQNVNVDVKYIVSPMEFYVMKVSTYTYSETIMLECYMQF